MPELPEVETLRRGLSVRLEGQQIETVIIRETRLRRPILPELKTLLVGQTIQKIQRRGKYLLVECTQGHLLIHLGMSGSLKLLTPHTSVKKHDHVDIIFSDALCLRYHDPRRFGMIVWTVEPPLTHPLLQALGIEPLDDHFSGYYLQQAARGRRCQIKLFIMNPHVVVGVGNIYANEALFSARIHPARSVTTLKLAEYQRLVASIQATLVTAIEQGGTTLRDFSDSDGNPGYFSRSLQVYGREGQPCYQCGTLIEQCRLGQRASYFCPTCQIVVS